jgi:hypothetical protein
MNLLLSLDTHVFLDVSHKFGLLTDDEVICFKRRHIRLSLKEVDCTNSPLKKRDRLYPC